MGQLVGVLGGLGPLATVYFMQSVIDCTEAHSDQDHVDMVVTQHSSTPDRTAAILDGGESPAPAMAADARMLEKAGADFIVIPCNTATNFMQAVECAVQIPVVNIVAQTVAELKRRGVGKGDLVAILATKGTIASGIYQEELTKAGYKPLVPAESLQERVTALIYRFVKAGRKVPAEEFYAVIDAVKANGAQAVVTGCTELSVVYKDLQVSDRAVIDSLDVLARLTVVKAGKKLKND